ncbi:MAG: hypothetical protein HY686_01395 [Chloroflexi bacterium]|nr:hypothetical protein [Chloroflexota bacterium]
MRGLGSTRGCGAGSRGRRGRENRRRISESPIGFPEEAVPYNDLGKRYECKVCGTQVIVTRAGASQKAPLACHGQPMEWKG